MPEKTTTVKLGNLLGGEVTPRGVEISGSRVEQPLIRNPNTVLITLQGIQLRSLIDSGADKSMIHERVYNMLKHKPTLRKEKVNYQSVTGNDIKILGNTTLEFKIGGAKVQQEFTVANFNRNVILGTDFLTKFGARIYMDLKQMRIKIDKSLYYIPFENDVYVSSIARLSKTTLIKPYTIYLVKAQLKTTHPFDKDLCYQITKTEKGFIADQPELEISNTISNLKDNKFIPIQITNNSGRYFKLKRGCVLGKIEEVKVSNSIHQNKTHVSDTEFDNLISVDPEHFSEVSKLLHQYRDTFAFSDQELIGTDLIEADIDTRDHKPVNMKPYRTPLALQKVVGESLDAMLDSGIIRPSMSPWCAPVVVVEKKPDSTGVRPPPRIAVDYRGLNKCIFPIFYPIPRIDDTLGKLNGCTFFTSLDLRQGFHQIKLTPEAAEKTAFACFHGKYEYTRVPFGIHNSPTIFQKMVDKLLSGLEYCCNAYLDDLLIFSKGDLTDHLQKVELVLRRLRKHTLKLKLTKCYFAKTELNYLGFVINQKGIKPNQEKIRAIRLIPSPTTVRLVRSFMGMVGYYRNIIPNFSKIAEPLTNLTRKFARFKWDDNCEKAFNYLKDSLTVIPLLFYPDVNKPYILYTDASDTCCGAVLVQTELNEEGKEVEKPIHFLSHKLNPSQAKNWSTVEKEAFAIHFALNKLRYYLHHAVVTIRTDHKPLEWLLKSEIKNRRVQAWSLTIASYNCQIEYFKGKDNVVADLLSRSPSSGENEIRSEEIDEIEDLSFNINVINTNEINPKDYVAVDLEQVDYRIQEEIPTLPHFDMVSEQIKDEEILRIKNKLLGGRADKQLTKKMTVIENIVYYISDVDDNPHLRVYIPKHLEEKVLNQYHEDNGHMGVQKVFKTIKEKYYFPNLFKKINDRIEKCVTCQQRIMQAQKAPITETGMPPYPFACISIDLSGPYKETISGNVYICSVVDIYSKWVEAFPLKDKTADSIIHVLEEYIFPRHSYPISLLSDNGSEFTNHAFEEVLKHYNIHHMYSSPYHPEGNSAVERSHRTLHDIIAKKINDRVDEWDIHLNSALGALRTNVCETTQKTPFEVLYCRSATLPLDNLLKPRRKYVGEEYHKQAIENTHVNFLQTLKHTRKSKKENMKNEKRRHATEFKVGDPVYYRNHTKSNKLENNWKINYQIVEKTGPLSFKIRNQLTCKVYRAHANSLRHAKTDWPIPKIEKESKTRRTKWVESPASSDSEDNPSIEGEDNSEKEQVNNDVSDSYDSDATIEYDPMDYEKEQANNDVPDNHDSDATIEYDPNDHEEEQKLAKIKRIIHEGSPVEQLQKYKRRKNTPSSEEDDQIDSGSNPEEMEIDQ